MTSRRVPHCGAVTKPGILPDPDVPEARRSWVFLKVRQTRCRIPGLFTVRDDKRWRREPPGGPSNLAASRFGDRTLPKLDPSEARSIPRPGTRPPRIRQLYRGLRLPGESSGHGSLEVVAISTTGISHIKPTSRHIFLRGPTIDRRSGYSPRRGASPISQPRPCLVFDRL